MKADDRFLFDERHYLRHPDLQQAKSNHASFDLLQHFLDQGSREGRSPSLLLNLHFVRYKLNRYLGIDVPLADTLQAFLDLPRAERFVPNPWFSPWSFRRLYGETCGGIGRLGDYELLEFYATHVRERAFSPNGLFSEERYREQYPGVAAAITRGEFGSGFLHFVYQGAEAGNANLPHFDRQGFRAAGQSEQDYVLGHHADLRSVVPWFDETFYLAVNDDVHYLKRREVIRSGLEHFLVVGFRERRVPHPALLDDMGRHRDGDAWSFGAAMPATIPRRIGIEQASRLLRHLAAPRSGLDRRRLTATVWQYVEPPPVAGTFDEPRYLGANRDVAQALAADPSGSAARHWRESGLEEQRFAPASNVFGTRTLTAEDVRSWRHGVNFFGPLSAPSGLGGAARGFVAALRAATVPVATHDVSGLIDPNLPLDLCAPDDLGYAINFFFLNPDRILPFVHRFGTAVFDRRANVGSWVWELASPRPEWRAILSAFDLILAPSDFCAASFASLTDRPVVTCPYVVDAAALQAERRKFRANRWLTRIEREKSTGRRIVLFIMDASSYVARKGVDVFLAMAARFEKERPGQCLFVVKRHSRDRSNIDYRAGGHALLVIDEVLSLPDLLQLKSLADVYVSPHRSEGFGLNVFESIVLDVPALVSRYGGGLDRLPDDYPYWIRGELAEVGRDMGPYRQHAVWFEPSLEAACAALAALLDARGRGARFRQIARAVRAELSLAAVGARLRQVLEQHAGLHAAPNGARARKLVESVPADESLDYPLAPVDGAAPLDQLPEVIAFSITPLFTVVTPTHDTDPAFLDDLHHDLVAQSFPGWEWCICDDGSTRPETIAKLREIRRADARVRIVFRQRSGGISAATNAAANLACGRYLVMVDHDDRLHTDLLNAYHDAIQRDGSRDVLYCDEDKLDLDGWRCEPFFKPDWSPEFVMSTMYVLHCLCVRKRMFLSLQGFRSEYDGAQDHDFVLRAAAAGATVHHVDRLLYHWRKTPASTATTSAAKPAATEAGRRAVAAYLRSLGLRGTVEHGRYTGSYRARPAISRGRVSLNILTACTPVRGEDRSYAEQFVRSILAHEPPVDCEIRVIVDEPRLAAAANLPKLDKRVRVVPFRRSGADFSFAEKANFAAATSACERIVLLNDDMEAVDADWLPALLEMLELPGVGVVGGRLLREDRTIQHAGIVFGIFGCCAHIFDGMMADKIGSNAFNSHVIRNYSAVTGALMAFRRPVFDAAGGFDTGFPIDYNDLDFCLRVIELGWRVVYTPFAELKHYESRSARRLQPDSLDTERFRARWGAVIARDPHYNPHLRRDGVAYEPPTAQPVAPAVSASATVRRRLIESFKAQGLVVGEEPELRIVVGNETVASRELGNSAYRFALPASGVDVRIVSRTFIPATVFGDSDDLRPLGVCITAMTLLNGEKAREIAIDDPALVEGFYPAEHHEAASWRWTNGDARLPASLLAGITPGSELEVRLLWRGYYWGRAEPDRAAAASTDGAAAPTNGVEPPARSRRKAPRRAPGAARQAV
jgi:GT2 family glycosyltransferase/glycosyltransferase involved in cell wall biosynthesis